jgi:hypothetical protein
MLTPESHYRISMHDSAHIYALSGQQGAENHGKTLARFRLTTIERALHTLCRGYEQGCGALGIGRGAGLADGSPEREREP